MRKLVLGALGLMLTAAWAHGAAVEITLSYAPDDVLVSSTGAFQWVQLRGPRSELTGPPGTPWLPRQIIHVAIDPGRQVRHCRVVVDEEAALPGSFHLAPAQPPEPLWATRATPTPPDMAVYRQHRRLRSQAGHFVNTIDVRGQRLAAVAVYPLDYIPGSGRLILRRRLRVVLETVPAERPARRYRRGRVFDDLLAADVVNPVDLAVDTIETGTDGPLELAATGPDPLDPSDPVHYLLICDATHIDAFTPLLDWKTRKGVPAAALSVDYITATYFGYSVQEKLKRCIIDFAQNRGTEWVVLGGDIAIIPDQNCYGEVQSTSATYTDSYIPTDWYYACLDDIYWDDDADGKVGEVGDDTIDLGPDVFLGRLSVNTAAQATAIVNKILAYEQSPPATGYARKYLSCGVELWDWPESTVSDAEAKLEQLYGNYVAPYWSGLKYRFYDTNTDFTGGAAYTVSDIHLNEQFAAGYNLMHLYTHGNTSSWALESGSYSTSDADAAANAGRYVNVVTGACETNGFDRADACLGEAMLRNPNGAAVSYIGSSRYGWGYPETANPGPSLQYNQMFYKYLFTDQPPERPQRLGAVYAQMKQYWVSSSQEYGAKRWLQFALNLLGDPEMPLLTDDPATFPAVVTATEQAGGVFAIAVDAGIRDATVCLQGEGIYVVGVTDRKGNFGQAVAPSGPTLLHVTITAPNHYPYQQDFDVTPTGWCNHPDLNGDGWVDAADLVLLLGSWMTEDYAVNLAAPDSTGWIDLHDVAVLRAAWHTTGP